MGEASRKAQNIDVRREVYAEYLTAVYRFMDRVRELIAKLAENADTSECDSARRAYLEDWGRHLQPAYTPVLVAGPSQIEESAENLRFCLGDLAVSAAGSQRCPVKIGLSRPGSCIADAKRREALITALSARRSVLLVVDQVWPLGQAQIWLMGMVREEYLSAHGEVQD